MRIQQATQVVDYSIDDFEQGRLTATIHPYDSLLIDAASIESLQWILLSELNLVAINLAAPIEFIELISQPLFQIRRTIWEDMNHRKREFLWGCFIFCPFLKDVHMVNIHNLYGKQPIQHPHYISVSSTYQF